MSNLPQWNCPMSTQFTTACISDTSSGRSSFNFYSGVRTRTFTSWSYPDKDRQSVKGDKGVVSGSSCTWFCCCVPEEKSERRSTRELHTLLLPSWEDGGTWEINLGIRVHLCGDGCPGGTGGGGRMWVDMAGEWQAGDGGNSARHKGIPLQLLEHFQALLEGEVRSDRVIFFRKYESKNQSISKHRLTMVLWQEGYTSTRMGKHRNESATKWVSSQN